MIAFSTELRARVILESLKGRGFDGGRAIDIGAGTGVVSKMLRDGLRLELVAADVKDQLDVDLPFIHMEDGGRLPFDDRHFDVAFLNDVLHHLPFQGQASLIKEAFRVAEKIFIFEVEPSRSARFVDWFFNRIHYRDMPLPMSFRNAGQWLLFLRGLGLEAEARIVPPPFRFYPLSHVAIHCSHEAEKSPVV